jgi:hypothetical protein
MKDAKSNHGLFVRGQGTYVTVNNCKFTGNGMSGVAVLAKVCMLILDACFTKLEAQKLTLSAPFGLAPAARCHIQSKAVPLVLIEKVAQHKHGFKNCASCSNSVPRRW